jgi:hypothetical protein
MRGVKTLRGMKHTLVVLTFAFLVVPLGILPSRGASSVIPGAQGNYGGLLQVPDADVALRLSASPSDRHVVRGHLPNETPFNSGTVTAQVRDSGQFSAVLNWQGYKYSFKGQFDANGATFERDFPDRANEGETLSLRLILHTETRTIHCELDAQGVPDVAHPNGVYTAEGELSGAAPDEAAAQAFGGSLNTSFIDPPDYGSLPQDVRGDGFSVTRVSKGGGFAARLVGRLPDNEPFSAGSALRGTKYTIFSGLYFKQGRFGGLTVGDLSAADLVSIQNVLLWAKREGADRDYYPAGFETGYGVKTLIYIINSLGAGNPTKQIPPISINPGAVSATLTFRDGNLGELNGQDVILSAKVRISPFGVKVLGPNPQNVSMTTNAFAATWKGSFIHPVSGRRTSYHGAFSQKLPDKNGEGRGSFKGSLPTNTTGQVESGSVRLIVD